MRRRAAILYGCLMGYGGQVIASRSVGTPLVEDGDRLSHALEGILAFIERAYPSSERQPFEALDHGPVRVLVERGRFCMLILVVDSHEDASLRQGMREILASFEERNEASLREGTYDRRLTKDGRESLTTVSNLVKVF